MQELINKPDLAESLARIDAWFHQEVLDRPPIRFMAHNSTHVEQFHPTHRWATLKDRWFDAEYQVDSFIESLRNKVFLAETFPVFMPNLGPEIYSAFYGCDLIFQEVTSYCVPKVEKWSDMRRLVFDRNNEYYLKIEELTRVALAKCDGTYWVGYTDLHPGGDCAAAWRDPQQLCMDIIHSPGEVAELVLRASTDFRMIYDHYDTLLKSHDQPSVTWMGIPSQGRMHVPSCDFSALISPHHFKEFFLDSIRHEISSMTHNIFHLDGKGVARHLDQLLAIPEIHAIQWVQGLGQDQPIMQWMPLIHKILDVGKSILLEVSLDEMEPLMHEVSPRGIMLCMSVAQNEQQTVLQKLHSWK